MVKFCVDLRVGPIAPDGEDTICNVTRLEIDHISYTGQPGGLPKYKRKAPCVVRLGGLSENVGIKLVEVRDLHSRHATRPTLRGKAAAAYINALVGYRINAHVVISQGVTVTCESAFGRYACLLHQAT